MKKQGIGRIQELFGRALASIAEGYLKKFQPRVVVVAGSVGKTATTQAVATVLSERFRVRATHANYNTATGVPLSIFGETFPVSRAGWIALLPRMWWRAQKRQDFDLLVLEIGTDRPDELRKFAYLRPELGVVTAVSPEHMEFFKSIETVAAEELSVGDFCEQLIINRDMVRPAFIKKYARASVQLIGERTDYKIARSSGNVLTLQCGPLTLRNVRTHLVGTHSQHALLAAAAVAQTLDMSEKSIRRGLQNITPIPGRMQLLDGKKHSKIIDDTYNSSPEAAIAALNTLYEMPGKQRIALLGNMNELGKTAARAHRTIGNHCDPDKLDFVVTLGPMANKYTARFARQRGCEVIETTSPYAAAGIISDRLKSHAVVLAKGSQNEVFAEETVKQLLKNPRDSKKLVRQTPYWLAVKRIAFSDAPD
jgi:UDP-N-acetylmuramoyl-tripeptide--D-alanyl-D-alanine ligase